MSKANFEACYHCKPPKRTPGCHGTCPEYAKERAAWEEKKKKMDAERDKECFLSHIERQRDLRISRLKRR